MHETSLQFVPDCTVLQDSLYLKILKIKCSDTKMSYKWAARQILLGDGVLDCYCQYLISIIYICFLCTLLQSVYAITNILTLFYLLFWLIWPPSLKAELLPPYPPGTE